MRKSLIVSFVVFALAALVAPTASAQKMSHRVSTAFAPANAELDRYPFEKAPTTNKKAAEFVDRMWNRGLAVQALRYPWIGYNYHAEVEGGRWILETLPAGTYVWVDRMGNQLYKFDCANRLVWTGGHSGPCPVCLPSVRNPGGSEHGGNSSQKLDVAGRPMWRFWGIVKGVWNAVGSLWRGLGGLLGRIFGGLFGIIGNLAALIIGLFLLAAPFIILIAIACLIYEMLRGNGGGAAPAAPVVAAPASTDAAVVQVPPPADGAQADNDRPLSIDRNEDGSHTIDLDGFRRVTATRRNGRTTFQIFP